MIIEIKKGIEFDTEKPFSEQSFSCQDYFYNIMNGSPSNVVRDEFKRPIVEFWMLENPLQGYVIERVSVYQKQEADWHLQSQTIDIKEVENE